MITTNSCAGGRETPRTKNQLKYIHDDSLSDSPKDRPNSHFGHQILPNKNMPLNCIITYATNISGTTQSIKTEQGIQCQFSKGTGERGLLAS